jgi:hypothetical protein
MNKAIVIVCPVSVKKCKIENGTLGPWNTVKIGFSRLKEEPVRYGYLTVCLALVLVPTLAFGQWMSWNDGDNFFDDLRGRGDSWFNNDNTTSRNNNYGNNGYTYGGGRPTRSQGEVKPSKKPWSGDWWPRGPAGLAFKNTGGGLAPFEKYDSLVYDLYGRLPGATAWEADPQNQHNTAPQGGQNWAGHCNGLAAASILAQQPTRPIQINLQKGKVAKLNWPSAKQCRFGLFRDGQFDYQFYSARTMTLSIDDMKGWLSEVYMNCETQQVGGGSGILGTRYNHQNINMNDPAFQDIYPQNYHYLLETFIKQRGQSFVAEVDPHSPVNNHPVYAYDCQMTPAQGYTRCRTKVYMTDYAPRANYVGTATMTRSYDYALIYDNYGRITKGQWIGNSASKHPDFVWIPVGDRQAYGTYENPCINAGFVNAVFNHFGAYGQYRR